MKKHPIAISTVGLLLLATGCRTSEEPQSEMDDGQQESVEQNIQGQWQGRSAPHLYWGGFSVEADFIYWRADEGGLEYATSGKHVEKPHIKWDPGFKIGIGYVLEQHDFWDIFLRWTHFQSHQHGKKDGTVLPWWSPTFLGGAATSAKAKWKLRFNLLDLELGHDYFISKAIAIRPLLGLRGASIRQHYDASYQGVFSTGPLSTSFKAQNNFSGVGIRAGAQMSWYFVEDWSVIGSLTGSLLYGHFNIKQHVRGLSTTSIDQELSRVAPNLETSLGFQWEKFFCKDQYRIAVSLAYEFSQWFSQNQMTRPELIDGNGQTNVTHFEKINGDLGLQGGTLQVRFDF